MIDLYLENGSPRANESISLPLRSISMVELLQESGAEFRKALDITDDI
jgi:hypothetical protein